MNILIVDDEAPIRIGIEKRIRKYGYAVENIYQASYARQAIDILERTRIDLVFADINMPFMSGLDFIERYKGSDTAFVIVSGYDEFSYAQRAIELGVERYLLKPINPKEFQSIMDEMMKRYQLKNGKEEYGAAAGQILACIREHIADAGFSLTICAESLSMSESSLGKILKKDVGIGFSDLLNQCRIERATQLIGKNDGKIRSASLASECGFSSQQYFSVVFRKVTGMTPRQYKDKMMKTDEA
ncbi:MAG: response regulator [Lachnospiraceae bacterium]|nr:response regulator [Lachnospiraceae bacterium]